jgi:hypothetical protein
MQILVGVAVVDVREKRQELFAEDAVCTVPVAISKAVNKVVVRFRT